MLYSRNVRVWAYPAPTDLRLGFNGLCGLVRNSLAREVLTGDLFLFVNKSCKATKILYWDGTGLVVLHKKLARGTFPRLWKRLEEGNSRGIGLTQNELNLFLEGCKLLEKQPLSSEDLSLILLAS